MKTQLPILLFSATHLRTQLLTAWNESKADVQKVLDAYNALGLPKIEPNEFDRLFNDFEPLMYDKLTGGNTHFVGDNGSNIKVDPAKALDMMAKPAGYNTFIAILAACDAAFAEPYNQDFSLGSHFKRGDISKYFKIDENGKLQFSDELQSRIDETGKRYVRTEKGAAVLDFIDKVAAAFIETGMPDLFPRNTNELPAAVVADILQQHLTRIDYQTGKAVYKFVNAAVYSGIDWMADNKGWKPTTAW